MEKKKVTAAVYRQEQLTASIYDMWIETDLAKEARPGQFLMVYPRSAATLLPRPISICEIDRECGRLRIVYRVAGQGTADFSTYRAGETIQILGALGNGFPLEAALEKRVLFVGGGIGIPPMLALAREFIVGEGILQAPAALHAVLGYRDGNLFLKNDIDRYVKTVIATEDGSVGIKGNVMDAIAAQGITADVIYACGPVPMLRAVKQYAGEHGIPAYISLEERMACGVGACLGCVCKTVKKDAHSQVNNARVCTDGPVFLADDVNI